MAENVYRKPESKHKKRSKLSFLSNAFSMGSAFENGVPLRYFPVFLLFFFLVIVYIGNGHFSDKTARKIRRLEQSVENLRVDYITLKEESMVASKQSEVARRVGEIGLVESLEPPYKIVIAKDEY